MSYVVDNILPEIENNGNIFLLDSLQLRNRENRIPFVKYGSSHPEFEFRFNKELEKAHAPIPLKNKKQD